MMRSQVLQAISSFSLHVLMPCGKQLVTPSLCRGQLLDATLILKIFNRASIYVRPSEFLEVSFMNVIYAYLLYLHSHTLCFYVCTVKNDKQNQFTMEGTF